MIDVERMLMSPIAMKEKWRDKANSAEGQMLHFPINAERYMLASKLDFVGEFRRPLGHRVDRDDSSPFRCRTWPSRKGAISTRWRARRSPSRPATPSSSRSSPRSWASPSRPTGRTWVAGCGRSSDTISRRSRTISRMRSRWRMARITWSSRWTWETCSRRAWYATGCITESLAGKQVDLDTLTKVVTSVKGVTLTVEATERLNGKIRIDLGESPTPIKDVARVLILEVLEKNGMLLDEMKDWRLLPEAKAIVARGEDDHQGAEDPDRSDPLPRGRRSTSREPESKETPPATANSPSTQDSKLAASKKYFQHISLLLDDLRTEVKGAQKAKFAQMMLNKAALEIDRLPVLNVDEELLAYGAGVSSSLRGMRNLSKNAGLDFQYRKAAMQGNAAGYGLWLWGILRRGFRRWRHDEHLPPGDRPAPVERARRPDHARGKDRRDAQEDDAQVPGRVLSCAERGFANSRSEGGHPMADPEASRMSHRFSGSPTSSAR